MTYRVGVSTGLYTVARAEELSDVLKKLGFAMTRGTGVIELTGDIPHEVNISDGVGLWHMAKKQGLDLTFHGSLTVPIETPERIEWRDAQDHMEKSVRSAVYAGCKYVNFHACLSVWLELLTYAGKKLRMIFCDHEGNFISEILKECKPLREWLAETQTREYQYSIVTEKELSNEHSRAYIETEEIVNRKMSDIRRREETGQITHEQAVAEIRAVSEEQAKIRADITLKNVQSLMVKKLERGDRWYSESMRGDVEAIDGYMIMAHYLFYTKDPLWVEMARMYKINVDYGNKLWVDEAWEKAEKENDRWFKEFFYAACGAKFLEGHTKKLLEWMNTKLKKGIEAEPLSETFTKEDKERMLKTLREVNIVYESPDARDPSHAGLFILWSPRQVYAAVKMIRQTLKTEKVWMLMDYEHVATQGIDPVVDMREVMKLAPDFGKYVYSVHCNPPNPLHPMDPIEIGDVRVYNLLWMLRQTGFGKVGERYLIFERGGAKDPFERSVEMLKLCVKYLEMDMPPEKLPPEFFGVEGPTTGNIIRQGQIVKDHAWEPLKDLLEMPEEEWTFLSQAAVRKGKRPEVWKRAEFR